MYFAIAQNGSQKSHKNKMSAGLLSCFSAQCLWIFCLLNYFGIILNLEIDVRQGCLTLVKSKTVGTAET